MLILNGLLNKKSLLAGLLLALLSSPAIPQFFQPISRSAHILNQPYKFRGIYFYFVHRTNQNVPFSLSLMPHKMEFYRKRYNPKIDYAYGFYIDLPIAADIFIGGKYSPGFDRYTDNVDYSPSGYDLYFTYDYLDKMGEITVCQTCSYHNQIWLQHTTPIGPSKEWLGFVGYIGDWWKRTTPPVTHTYSPKSPANNPYWRNSSDSTTRGFGNTLGFFEDLVASISWVLDSSAGDTPNPGNPPREF